VDNELEVIRNEMEHTRSSLADKLEALESEFRGTVEGASNAVESVQEAVANVKESVQETVETVKETFNVSKHVERHPWAMFGGAFMLGCFAGAMLGRSRRPRTSRSEDRPAFVAEPAQQPVARNGHGSRNGASKKETETSTEEPGPFQPVLQSLKGLAVGTLMGVLRDTIVNAAPSNLAPDLARVVDDMTTRLGGKTLRRSEETNENDTGSEGENDHVGTDPAEVGRPLGATRWSR